MNKCILEGESMGGAIVTHISESGDLRFDGIMGIGAALLVREYDSNNNVSKIILYKLKNFSRIFKDFYSYF